MFVPCSNKQITISYTMGFRRFPEQTLRKLINKIGVWRNIPLVLFIFQLRKQKLPCVLGYIGYTHARVQVYAHDQTRLPPPVLSISMSRVGMGMCSLRLLTFRARLARQGALRTLLPLAQRWGSTYAVTLHFLYGSQRFKLEPLHLHGNHSLNHHPRPENQQLLFKF